MTKIGCMCTCDRCGKTEFVETSLVSKLHESLPQGWSELKIRDSEKSYGSEILCDECYQSYREWLVRPQF